MCVFIAEADECFLACSVFCAHLSDCERSPRAAGTLSIHCGHFLCTVLCGIEQQSCNYMMTGRSAAHSGWKYGGRERNREAVTFSSNHNKSTAVLSLVLFRL